MSSEHAELEADWLADELKRATEYARTAYEAHDEQKRQLFLANLIGTLDSLYTHYRIPPPNPNAPDGEIVYEPYRNGKKERGPIMRFFFGDGR